MLCSTIVMVEQNFHFAAPLANRISMMEHGRVVEEVEAAELEPRTPALLEVLGL